MRMKILTLGLICLLVLGSVLSGEERDPIKSWQELFPDPVERIYIFMKDKVVFRATNNDEKRIYMSFGILEKELKARNYKIEDVAIIIHNHFIGDEFSDDDLKQYRMLKKRGFNGLLLLYCHRTNKTISYGDRESAKLLP